MMAVVMIGGYGVGD